MVVLCGALLWVVLLSVVLCCVVLSLGCTLFVLSVRSQRYVSDEAGLDQPQLPNFGLDRELWQSEWQIGRRGSVSLV